MNAPRKKGRPPLPASCRKQRFVLLLAPEDFELIRREAYVRGQSRNSLVCEFLEKGGLAALRERRSE